MFNQQSASPRRAAFALGAGVLPFAALLLFLFGKVIFGGDLFAYRDAGYYHYPFARQIESRLAAGELPLWDPYENLGVPLAGNPAAAVFYPVRAAVFAAVGRGVPFNAAYKFYVLVHLAVAFGAFLYLARTPLSRGEREPVFLCTPLGASAGALAWTFGGQILFQVTNIPFLIGAAWLPFLLGGFLRLATHPRIPSAAVSALALAMMITGGDPQTALFGILPAVPLFFFCRRKSPFSSTSRSGRSAAALIASILLGLALAAVQIFPAAETALDSSRSSSPGETPAERRETELGIYNFSLPPWRTAELLWPGIGGHEFPENTRWLTAIPGDRQIWTPSIYMGLFPLLAALAAFRFRRRPCGVTVSPGAAGLRVSIRILFSWLALFALLAAWGGFGFGWLLRAFREPGLFPSAPFKASDPVGGVYWLMIRLFPGWSLFRYPAKMMTFAALALSLLAGIGWEKLIRPRRIARGLWILLFVSLAGFLAVRFAHPGRLLVRCGAEFGGLKTLYGPLIPGAAKMSAACAFAQTAVLTFLLIALRLLCRIPRIAHPGRKVFLLAALLLLALDLAGSQKWFLRGAPEKAFRASSPIASELRRRSEDRPAPPRLFRDSYLYPRQYLDRTSFRRLEERIYWDRRTLFQKNAALAHVANLDVRGTFVPAGYLSISRYLRSELRRWRLSGERSAGLDRLLAALGADAFLVSARGIQFGAVPGGGKRVHIVHHPEKYAVWQDLVRHRLEREPLEGESAEIMRYEPERIDIRVSLVCPGMILLAEQYFPGWQARVSGTDGVFRSVPVRRAASALRAVDLPAGTSTVVMEYRPIPLRIGIAVTLAALAVTLALLVSAVIRPFCRRPKALFGPREKTA